MYESVDSIYNENMNVSLKDHIVFHLKEFLTASVLY